MCGGTGAQCHAQQWNTNFGLARIGVLGVCSEASQAEAYFLGGVVLRVFNRLGKLSRRRKIVGRIDHSMNILVIRQNVRRGAENLNTANLASPKNGVFHTNMFFLYRYYYVCWSTLNIHAISLSSALLSFLDTIDTAKKRGDEI